MSLFLCSACGCIENTATSMYWIRGDKLTPPLCSECDPKLGRWHGRFPKRVPLPSEYRLISTDFIELVPKERS